MKTTLEPVTALTVLHKLQVCLPYLELLPAQKLSEQRIDSIDYVDLLCTIHAEFGVRLSEADLAGDVTLEELALFVADRSDRQRRGDLTSCQRTPASTLL